MRIAHLIWALGTGGAETMLVDIVNAQVATETVAIAVINDVIEEGLLKKIDKRCLVKLFRRKIGSKNPLPWIKLNAFFFKYKPDIIHFHLEGMRKMVFHPAPKVITIHNAYSSNKEYPKYRALFAISDGVKNYTKQQGFESITVWNGIDTKSIKINNNANALQFSICKMVCVGRLRFVHKGQDVLVNAMSVLKQEGITNIHLDFIGDGESRKELEWLIAERNLQNHVTILGQKDRSYIYEHLCDYNLFVLPSRSEGFGLAVAEAMCAKIPVLVSNLEGPMGVIDGGRLGMWFDSENIQDLADKLKLFLIKGYDDSLLEEAYKYAISHFDINRTARQYIDEYKKVLE